MNYYNRILSLSFLGISIYASAMDFGTTFNDSTLRIDYILSGKAGNPAESDISLATLRLSGKWYGRRVNLDKTPVRGNGEVTVKSLKGDTIYRTVFSSLFNEWMSTSDACGRAFEHSVLVPAPIDTASVSLSLFDPYGNAFASHSFIYVPGNNGIRRDSDEKRKSYRYIHKSGEPENAIDIAVLAEGFTAGEKEKFYKNAEDVVNEILRYEPFKSKASSLNFIAVETVSQESGVSVPRLGKWHDTAFESHFDTFGSERYLTTDKVFAMHDALRGIPYEHIILLANTDEYGAAGIFNSYVTVAGNNQHFRPVAVHEFGHSFGGLGDEYFYENDVLNETYPPDAEPWEPNITTLVDFNSKWQDMLPEDVPVPTLPEQREEYPVGVYEGGGYQFKGIYRPADECRMRNNTWPDFCPVCVRSISRLIDFHLIQQ